MRHRLARIVRKLLYGILHLLLPAMAPLVRIMATTGAGSEACLRRGCLAMPVHFYSPVLDVQALERRQVWDRRSDLPGIELNVGAQLELLRNLGRRYGNECQWPEEKGVDQQQFHTNNSSFSFGCAAALYSIIRFHRSRRVIEIGSGHSSLVISQALQVNARDDRSYECSYTIVDPYPRKMLKALPGLSEIAAVEVETKDVAFFQSLKRDDILFIDSSHVVRTGGDVNFLYLDVLPLLKPGVLIHCHDIPLPFEYPKAYATNPRFRVFWTEAYLLQAFLAFNADFEVLLALALIQTDHFGEFQKAFPHFSPASTSYQSGSFWIRRKDSAT